MQHRFSRQEPLVGAQGQRRLKRSSVVIVGLGALGTVQAELLCRAGVGHLTLIDHDVVEESNLQRQALYTSEDVGMPKVEAAKKRLESIWPEITVDAVAGYLSLRMLSLLDEADVVLDGTDNMEVRLLMNEYCKKHSILAVFASAILDRGSVLPVTDTPCYACVFRGKGSEEDCATSGVYNAATHLAATISAHEALKVLLKQEPLKGLFSFSLSDNRYDVFKTAPRSGCEVCAGSFERLESKTPFSIRACKSIGGLRAEPLAARAKKEKALSFGGEEKDGLVRVMIEGYELLVDSYGGVRFPKLKDADKALTLVKKVL